MPYIEPSKYQDMLLKSAKDGETITRLAAETKELVEALERVRGMCVTEHGKVIAERNGVPTGLPAIVACVDAALKKARGQ